jgi:ubiquinone/menaquinone biosynthesis C-methylase UbiE
MQTYTHVDLDAIKSRQRQAWATGDFSRLATRVVYVSEQLCEAADLQPLQKVLDVATGSGNAALAAARRECDVIGVDYVDELLEEARKRAAVEKLQIQFLRGDAENLLFPDNSFDVVTSTFGVMFAPRQDKAAQELLRVCKPGGKIALANWTEDSFVGEMFRVISRYMSPPPGLKPPSKWGDENYLRELFGQGVSSLQTNRKSFAFRFRSPEHWLEFHQMYFGPIITVLELLGPAQRESLQRDLLAAARNYNRSGNSVLIAPSDYLEVIAVKRG